MNQEIPQENIAYPKIAEEIKMMCKADQDMREAWEDGDFSDENLDEIHTERMKKIVAEIGWPTITKVGKDVSEEAWLLVQHADHDVEFQELCLSLMKTESENEVERINIAYLEDRVRINKGKSQLYGTQFEQRNNQHIPREIEDIENVDARRAELGMGPLQEQIDLMYEKYPFKDRDQS